MNRLFIKQNITSLSILLFIILFGIMAYVKPSFIFHKDGTVRQFGIGYKNKTVIPIWLIVIIMAYLSYLFLLYLQVFQKTTEWGSPPYLFKANHHFHIFCFDTFNCRNRQFFALLPSFILFAFYFTLHFILHFICNIQIFTRR